MIHINYIYSESWQNRLHFKQKGRDSSINNDISTRWQFNWKVSVTRIRPVDKQLSRIPYCKETLCRPVVLIISADRPRLIATCWQSVCVYKFNHLPESDCTQSELDRGFFRDRLPPTMTLCDRIRSPLDDHLVVKLNSIDRQMHKQIHSSHHATVFFQTQRHCPLIFTLVWLSLDLLLKWSGLHPPQALCCASFAFLSTLSRLLEIVPVKEWQKKRRPGIFPYNLPWQPVVV